MGYVCEPGSYRNYYYGRSTDEKPTVHVPDSSFLYEMDTQRFYMFDAVNVLWILQTKAGTSNASESAGEP